MTELLAPRRMVELEVDGRPVRVFEGETILAADLDLGDIGRGKFDFDVAGHYSRPDVFQLVVNESPAAPVVTK